MINGWKQQRVQGDSEWSRTIFLDKSEEVINWMGVVVSFVVEQVEMKSQERRVSLTQLDALLLLGLSAFPPINIHTLNVPWLYLSEKSHMGTQFQVP